MDRKQSIELCICEACPSYMECKEEIAFCLSEGGSSKCIVRGVGCTCPECPVQGQMGFKHTYYCMRGSEREILSKKG